MEIAEKRTYSVEEASAILGISRNRLYEAVKRREVPNLRIGKRILIPKRALERLLERAES